MIDFATNQEVDRLKTLWHTGFDDAPLYVESYYAQRGNQVRTLVYRDPEIVAMLDLIPATLTLRDKQHKAVYIYAVVTLPQCRGKGIAHQLLASATEIAAEEGCIAALLIPQSKPLIRFYQAQGFCIPIYKNVVAIAAQEKMRQAPVASLPEPAFLEMKKSYQKQFSNAVRFDDAMLRLVYRQVISGGGYVLRVGDDYSICYREKNKLWIQEISASNDMLTYAVSTLCHYFSVGHATVQRFGGKTVYGLLMPLAKVAKSVNDIYMNTMLD